MHNNKEPPLIDFIDFNLGTGDVGVQILQGGSVEKPVPVFAFYNLSNEEQRILMGFSSKESIDGLIAALQHVRSVYYPPKKERKLEDTQQFDINSLKQKQRNHVVPR